MISLLSRASRLSYQLRYSRAMLQQQAIDYNAIKVAEQQQIQKKRVQRIYNLPANGKNPNNFIKVKINHKIYNVNPGQEYVEDKCWILQPDPVLKVPQVTVTAIRKYIITSIKKAKLALVCIKKRHVFDAINRLQTSNKKVCKVMIRTFYNLIDHAKQKGINPTRLWVHGYIIGKTKRYKGTRYHAKGRGYREKRDFCQVKIILGVKPQKQFFEQIGVGQCSPAIANMVRHGLKRQISGYAKLSRYTSITTAKGRQQAKLFFRRRVQKQMIENKQAGTYQPKRLVSKKIRQQLGLQAEKRINELMSQETSSLSIREKLYKKNMKI